MPHIPDVEKTQVVTVGKAETVGQLCWLFADKAIDQWNLNPRWATAHAIKRALRNPYHTDWSHQVVIQYAGSFDRQDIETAADLAFTELYRLVFAKYEDQKIQENGNALSRAVTFPVEAILDHPIEECKPECFDQTQAIEVAGTTITEEFTRKRGRPKGSKNKPKAEVA